MKLKENVATAISFAHMIKFVMDTNLLIILNYCFLRLRLQSKKKKFFNRYYYFKNIEYKKNGEILSWDVIPAEPKDLKNLSYSKRLAYLN